MPDPSRELNPGIHGAKASTDRSTGRPVGEEWNNKTTIII